jgi:hypothetical protein
MPLRLKASGSSFDQSTVMFGSGPDRGFFSVCSMRKLLRVTGGRPLRSMPTHSAAQ